MNILILGNSGSGKTTLAHQLAQTGCSEVISLDRLFWEPGGYQRKRPADQVLAEITEIKERDGWIVEGVFGELAELLMDRTTRLIWLDLPWEACRTGLLMRGSESARQLDPQAAEENFRKLLTWAEAYWSRDDLRSHAGHQRLFERFVGEKHRLLSREEADAFRL
jgi:adenylate kinase family enzyme